MAEIRIGVDIGGSHISAMPIQNQSAINSTFTHRKVNSKADATSILTVWSNTINQCIYKIRDKEEIRGVGIAMPGAFNYQNGIALFQDTDKYNSLYLIDIGKELRKVLSIKDLPIRFINDATAFALGSTYLQNIPEEHTALAIVLGTGFGTALIRNNLPLLEGGHVPDHGCFWHLPYKNGIADDYFSTRWFINRYFELSGRKVDGVKYIAERTEADNHAKQTFNEFGENLASFLLSHLQNLEIRNIIFGGNISKSLDQFKKPLQKALDHHQLTVKTHQSPYMEEATLLGSSLLLNQSFWRKVQPELSIR